MSEYQYEFQALDRPLTQREMRELRKYATRATITDTRFVNHYEWGNFKGDPSLGMRKYFDAFLYCANWGTHRLMLRLPSPALDIKTAKRYLRGHSASAHRKDNILILDFAAQRATQGARRLSIRQCRPDPGCRRAERADEPQGGTPAIEAVDCGSSQFRKGRPALPFRNRGGSRRTR